MFGTSCIQTNSESNRFSFCSRTSWEKKGCLYLDGPTSIINKCLLFFPLVSATKALLTYSQLLLLRSYDCLTNSATPLGPKRMSSLLPSTQFFFVFVRKKKHLHPIHLVLANAFVSLHQGYMRVWFCLDQRKISINLKKQVVQNKCQVVMLQEDIVFLQRYSLKISCLDLVFNFFYRNIYSFL